VVLRVDGGGQGARPRSCGPRPRQGRAPADRGAPRPHPLRHHLGPRGGERATRCAVPATARLLAAITLDFAEGQIQGVSSIINPNKLPHLGPLADLGALQSSCGG
jgi:hypothetical protein